MSGENHNPTSLPVPDPHGPESISAETLNRCAELLADGEMDWPPGLSDEQQTELLTAVRRYRRARLVKFIASQIAADIARQNRGEARES